MAKQTRIVAEVDRRLSVVEELESVVSTITADLEPALENFGAIADDLKK
jgi:hypothetical protein